MARSVTAPDGEKSRLRIVGIFWLLLTALFIARLFYLQTAQHEKYSAQAAGARNLKQTIRAERGQIYGRDARAGQDATYPIALNRDQFILISDNRKITNASSTARMITETVKGDAVLEAQLVQKLSLSTRAYQPLIKDVKPEHADAIRAAVVDQNHTGIYFDRQPARLYPERELLSHVSGFVGRDERDGPIGRYGLEGFFDERLKGSDGFVTTEKDPFGGWIPVADRAFEQAVDGDSLIITIDRMIQLQLCDALAKGVAKHSARRGSGIVMDPKTGRIWAMCNVPNFDPNTYQKVEQPQVYNNDAIFRAYEPGSVFKAFTMAAALDGGAVNPTTTFQDEGFVKRDGFTIRNAASKVWGRADMTAVIKESINTGTVFAAEKLGADKFREYMENFGFGKKSGVELKVEEKGTVKSLSRKGSVFLATASFGQGLTTTPLQLVAGYGALANHGVLMQPQIVHGWKRTNGTTQVIEPTTVRRVISEKSAEQIGEMMRHVVDDGHGKTAAVRGYTIVGKTGTAQIVGANGKYEDETINNHTFIGYGPQHDARFVMLIMYEAPQARFAETTAVPTFGEVAGFLLEYLGVQPDKPNERT